jgi:2-polyprenyl-6-methoxyphenol hydroxylase-like FAD-dependent oxidoreductase
VASSRTLIVAGAGIGGLTTALALAHHGFRALVLEQAEKLQETGAGIQLAPNATRVLRTLMARRTGSSTVPICRRPWSRPCKPIRTSNCGSTSASTTLQNTRMA